MFACIYHITVYFIQFLQKELQKNIPFEIYFKDDNIEKYAIVRFGSKKEIVERKK